MKTNKKTNLTATKALRFIYGGVSVILITLAISIPQLIDPLKNTDSLTTANNIAQIVITGLLAASIWLSAKLYQRNLEQLKRIKKLKLDNGELEADMLAAVKHIGSVNVQLEAIKSALTYNNDYPKSKQDFKKVLEFFGQKIITIANVDWLVIRLVDKKHNRTLREYNQTRAGQALTRPEINNAALTKKHDGLIVISSDKSDLLVKTYCFLPKVKMRNEEDVLIKAILNQLEMLFIIFTSKYYKENLS